MQQVLRTELIRIKALIGTAAFLTIVILTLHLVDPYAVEHLWHGGLKPTDLYRILIPFILFELWVHFTHQPAFDAGSRLAGLPALSRRTDRNLDADASHWRCTSTAWGRWRRSDSWCR